MKVNRRTYQQVTSHVDCWRSARESYVGDSVTDAIVVGGLDESKNKGPKCYDLDGPVLFVVGSATESSGARRSDASTATECQPGKRHQLGLAFVGRVAIKVSRMKPRSSGRQQYRDFDPMQGSTLG